MLREEMTGDSVKRLIKAAGFERQLGLQALAQTNYRLNSPVRRILLEANGTSNALVFRDCICR